MIETLVVFGNGLCAEETARKLVKSGFTVSVISDAAMEESFAADLTGSKGLKIYPETLCTAFSGSVGAFTMTLKNKKGSFQMNAGGIVISEDAEQKPNFSLYGLTPGSNVVSLSGLRQCDVLPSYETALFLNGLYRESTPLALKETLQWCIELKKDFGIKPYLFTRQLKVAGRGLEALYQKAKETGTHFVKFTHTAPEIAQSGEGEIRVHFSDETMDKKFRLQPDLTVVDESIHPAAITETLAGLLQVETDPYGFAHSGNVHRETVFTNRKGIFAAGHARSIMPGHLIKADAHAIALELLKLKKEKTPPEGRARISDRCARCLTCYRVCPYHAIFIKGNHQIEVDPAACMACGICAAECPAGAAAISGGLDRGAVAELSKEENSAKAADTVVPSIVVFCCSRSAAQAGRLASLTGYTLPPGLKMVTVPCAGNISVQFLLEPFSSSADGVLVLTCHKGNCHSEYGNLYARKKVDGIKEMMAALGIDEKRMAANTLASNMGKEFARIANDFEKKIKDIGPLHL